MFFSQRSLLNAMFLDQEGVQNVFPKRKFEKVVDMSENCYKCQIFFSSEKLVQHKARFYDNYDYPSDIGSTFACCLVYTFLLIAYPLLRP